MQQKEAKQHDDLQTGHDLPNSDGTVSDEDVAAIDGPDGRLKGGKDHSLDNYSETIPTDGIGGVQDSSGTTTEVARIRDET